MRSTTFVLTASLFLSLFALRPAQSQTPGEINALIHGYLLAWNDGDMDAIAHYVHPGFIRHYAGHLPAEGRAALKQLIQTNRAAFSDFHVRVKDIVLTEDKVVVSWEASGTNDGPLFEDPPSGRRSKWSGMSIARIEDGMLREEWVVSDQLEMFRQLGYTLVRNDE